MPDNLTLYGLLVVAVGIGFAFGVWRGKHSARVTSNRPGGINSDFYQSLNYLLNDRDDLAVESLIEQLGIEESTFDTYLSLGALVRRRGEVDKAINIHQNLLARPDLSARKQRQAEMELAQDFFSAGLYGRAETLLVDLVKRGGETKSNAQLLLLGLYERQSDWGQALDIVRELVRHDKSQRTLAAHLCCELALQALPDSHSKAREHIAAGRKFDGQCARLTMVHGQIELEQGQFKQACKQFDKALELDPDLGVDMVELYRRASTGAGDSVRFVNFLEAAAPTTEDTNVSLLLEHGSALATRDGAAAAQQYLLGQLAHISSISQLTGLLAAIEPETLAAALPQGLQAQIVAHLRDLALQRHDFRCSNCGFGASTRHWRCPSCQLWGAWRAVA